MTDLIPPEVLPQIGAGGLVVLVVLLVLTGRLVPRAVVRDLRADRDARVAEARQAAEQWQAAHQALAGAVGDLTAQVGELTSIGRTTERLLTALHRESAA